MLTTDILIPERTVVSEQAYTQKTILEFISTLFIHTMPQLTVEEIYNSLSAREALGSTAIGHGVAIPHARLASVTHMMGTLVHAKTPIEFDALDGKPVDIIFTLLVPLDAADEHIKILALITKIFNDAEHREQIRRIKDSQALFQLVNSFAVFS